MRALQGAVAHDRVVHAYLFSGPRGTGKTTAARILAKALNCENPVDGDACDQCPSCVAITRGTSLDVTELDAASNNGVDDIREITSAAWHGTPGRWRVYIFDEVHQLSRAAAAALLKTLEEPPPHVVFVLATTDPHKVLPTIRSRTQHLEFRLLPGDTLSGLLHEIRDAAHLEADDETVEAAVRLGRGSARDALSALDQLVATGGSQEVRPSFEGLLAALADLDAPGALRAVATLGAEGWEPEQLTESLAAEVRQIFLLQVAPDLSDAVDAERGRLGALAPRFGLARTVRILETLGRALREMRSAPDKVIVLEVALARLVHPELDSGVEALEERLSRVERALAAGPAATPVADSAPRRPIGQASPSTSEPPEPPRLATPPTNSEAVPPAPAPPAAPSASPAASSAVTDSSAGAASFEELRAGFAERVVAKTSRAAQMLLRGAQVRALRGDTLVVALASEEACRSAAAYAGALRRAIEHEFRVGLDIEWAVDPSVASAPSVPSAPSRSRTASVATPVTEDEEVLEDDGGPGVVVDSVAEHLITEMFPGAEEIS